MIKYFFHSSEYGLYFPVRKDPIEPPIDPPGPGNRLSYRYPGIRIRVSGGKHILLSKCIATERKYSHVFCGNPNNLIMVDNIYHIKINPDGTKQVPKRPAARSIGFVDDHHV